MTHIAWLCDLECRQRGIGADGVFKLAQPIPVLRVPYRSDVPSDWVERHEIPPLPSFGTVEFLRDAKPLIVTENETVWIYRQQGPMVLAKEPR